MLVLLITKFGGVVSSGYSNVPPAILTWVVVRSTLTGAVIINLRRFLKQTPALETYPG